MSLHEPGNPGRKMARRRRCCSVMRVGLVREWPRRLPRPIQTRSRLPGIYLSPGIIGSNEMRSRIPVASASRSSVRVEGFVRPLSSRAITLRGTHAVGKVGLGQASVGASLNHRLD
jgi:hypothetical protein